MTIALDTHSTAVNKAFRTLRIALPVPNRHLDQDEEFVLVCIDGEWRDIRLHDYGQVYAVPGLYEKWVYDVLGCRSPQKIREALESCLDKAGVDPASLRVLDLGAGNGYVAAELKQMGATHFVGVDIVPEAAIAAERDRPGLYDEYVIGDLCDLPSKERRKLDNDTFNCLTCVAALGFGDIPTEVFAEAYNHVDDGGWIAFTIKEDFLDDSDQSGFSSLIRRMLDKGIMDVEVQSTYTHRMSTEHEPLLYVAFIGRKRRNIAEADLAG